MFRIRTPLLLIALVTAGCGGNKQGSTGGIPGGGNNTSGSGGVATLTIGSDVTIAKGRTHQFQAQLAHDGLLDDCTATGQWTSSDPAVASVSGGIATALGLGQTTITASCSGSADSAALLVTPAEVVSIAVTPATGELRLASPSSSPRSPRSPTRPPRTSPATSPGALPTSARSPSRTTWPILA